MPSPTRSDVHVSAPLTNLSVAFIQKATNFIADKLFPMVPVQKQSDRYYQYAKGQWYTDEAEERAPGTESAGSGYDVDATPTYYCKTYAFHKDVADEIRGNQDPGIDMDRDGTEFVTQKMLLKREKLFVTKFIGGSIWTSNKQGTTDFTKWSASGSDPVNDVEVWKQIIKLLTGGYVPNAMAVTSDVLAVLKANASIIDRIKYTQRGIITNDLLASMFGLDKFLELAAVENTAANPKTPVMANLASNQVLLCYAEPSPGLLKPSAGYNFAWTGMYGAGAYANRIKKFRMEELASDRIEGEMSFDQKVVAPEMGLRAYDLI